MAEIDWTETLLDRLGDVGSRRDMEPYEVTARISRIALYIARRQDQAFGRFGLNRGEVGVLGALFVARPNQELTPTQLFKGLLLSSAGITSRLDSLEHRGYVTRSRHPSDRRGVLVRLTEEGSRVLRKAIAADLEGERALLSGLTRSDQKALTALLKKTLRALEPPGGDGSGPG